MDLKPSIPVSIDGMAWSPAVKRWSRGKHSASSARVSARGSWCLSCLQDGQVIDSTADQLPQKGFMMFYVFTYDMIYIYIYVLMMIMVMI